MKQSKWLVLAGGVLAATAIACGTTPSPTAPAAAAPTSAEAGASGETLKVGAPTVQSPANSVQLTSSTAVLTFTAITGTYATFVPSYQIELKNAAGTLVANPTLTTTSYTVTATLAVDAIYTWRVRATYQGAFGPWSSTATFRTQAIPPAYISGNTIFDPLHTGNTVGQRVGSTTFVPGQGLRLNEQTSHVRYDLPTNLQAGEMSVFILGADEGGAGDKSKVLAMQEGTSDITDNDYRVTVELRGSSYSIPGSVNCRIITGDSDPEAGRIFDCSRSAVNFDSSRWYFWRFSWQTGQAQLTVRRDNETGPIVYNYVVGTGSRPYRPVPHTVYLGAPVGRAGPHDATIGGGPIYKNFWVGPTARPQFPASALLRELLPNPGGGN